jgi:hypothetical protein
MVISLRLQGNKPLETPVKIWARCNGLDQELMTYWADTLVWPDETPPASLDDSISTPRKQAFWNSCKNLSMLQWSDQEFRTSWARTLVWSLVLPDQAVLASSSNFSATPKKTTSINSCINLSTIQRSDQKLMIYWADIIVWPDET